jgi:hypothetical protein
MKKTRPQLRPIRVLGGEKLAAAQGGQSIRSLDRALRPIVTSLTSTEGLVGTDPVATTCFRSTE